MIGEYKGVHISFGKGVVQIENSYRITDDSFKREVIKAICDLDTNLSEYRTFQSLLTEWKAHNILFQHKYKMERTKDVDFEYKLSKLHKIGFWLIAHFMRERNDYGE